MFVRPRVFAQKSSDMKQKSDSATTGRRATMCARPKLHKALSTTYPAKNGKNHKFFKSHQ